MNYECLRMLLKGINMTNGDKIRQLNNENLARLIYGFIVTSKNSTLFQKLELDESKVEDSKGYQVLLETLNEEVNYE